MYFSVLDISDLAIAIAHAFRWLFALISTIIYDFIIRVYDLFIYISRVEILDNEIVQTIYRKVGFLLGLFMLFKLIFSLIQTLIDPSKINDKKKGFGSIIFRCLISIVLLGVTPALFKEAFKLQNLLIGSYDNSDNVIYKLIIGDSNVNSTSFGRIIASELYFSFYTDEEYPFLSNYSESDQTEFFDTKVEEIKSKIKNGEITSDGTKTYGFGYAQKFLNLKNEHDYYIEFNELFSVAIGFIVLWMLISYCIQISIRVFQIAYLQLIAPVPILSYISDPDGVFKKWIKQCTSTFLDLFIRLAIMYFIIYFAEYIVDLFETKNSVLIGSIGVSPNGHFMLYTLIEIFLLIGLLLFAKKVPELLKELFPNLSGSGNFGLMSPSKLWADVKSSPITNVAKTVTSPVGFLNKKLIRGIDTARSGYGFKQGWSEPKSKFGEWADKQRQTYTPYSAEMRKKRIEGRKEVIEINNKWNEGAKLAEKIMHKGGKNSYGRPDGWDGFLDGTTKSNYKLIFKNEEFITSKMNLDSAKKLQGDLSRGLQQVQAGGSYTYNGTRYTRKNLAALAKLVENQNNAVSGLKEVHESIRKQNSTDAATEDTFKFIKNNAANPANPSMTHTKRGI